MTKKNINETEMIIFWKF